MNIRDVLSREKLSNKYSKYVAMTSINNAQMSVFPVLFATSVANLEIVKLYLHVSVSSLVTKKEHQYNHEI